MFCWISGSACAGKARLSIALILPLLRQHKLHIVRFAAGGKAHSFRCASFPMGVRFAGSPIGFPPQAALANVPVRVSGRRYRRAGLYAPGSSYTGAPSGRALRSNYDRRLVGHDDPACRPRKRQTVKIKKFVRSQEFLHRRGDVCERRLWRETDGRSSEANAHRKGSTAE